MLQQLNKKNILNYSQNILQTSLFKIHYFYIYFFHIITHFLIIITKPTSSININ